MAALNSVNPVFVHFSVPADDAVSFAETDQKSASLMKKLSEPNGAKFGYGVGYAGTTQASAGNIRWDGPDIPFADPMHNLPWGEAILCKGTVADGKVTLEALSADLIHGVCYGTTVKDCSIMLNAGVSIAPLEKSEAVPKSETEGLYIAIMANAYIDDEDTLHFSNGRVSDDDSSVEGAGKASTVVAISDAIDPTVFNVGTEGMQYVIPKASAGYVFTVMGVLFKAPHFRHPRVRTSFKDQVSSYPTALAIVDAKTSSDSSSDGGDGGENP